MTPEETEMILLKCLVNDQEAFSMKLYKNGTTIRTGCGATPQLGISAMSFFGDARFFIPIIKRIPPQLLEQPQVYEEETPNGRLEYIMAFYGVSANGETGERAQWTKSTGVRILLDLKTTFRHPVLSLLDNMCTDAAEITNDWYFDIIMKSRWDMLSSTLPGETMIAQPKTEEEINRDYEQYINQMLMSSRNWQLTNYIRNKTYTRDNKTYRAEIQQDDQVFNVRFVPVE